MFNGGGTVKTIYNLPTYNKDNRLSIEELYNSYSKLEKKYWQKNKLNIQKINYRKHLYDYFLLTFKTKKTGKAIWLIAGMHGEEPAGPNAIAKNIDFINKLGKKIPVVLLPICNPLGYIKDWRYRYYEKAPKDIADVDIKSSGSSEHYLINHEDTRKPRRNKPVCKESELLTKFVLKNVKKYPPILVLDLHEDNCLSDSYIYSQGFLRHKDPIAKDIVNTLIKRKFKIKRTGYTRFKQKIVNGIVTNVRDGSIDELLSAYRIMVNKHVRRGPRAKSVVVVETNITRTPLKKRINAHTYILKKLKHFYTLGKKIKT